MEYLAKIIHKTHLSYLPTSYPVQFYGMPNGKVYIVFKRNTEIKSELEFVIAEHKEFTYDYSNNKLLFRKNGKIEKAFNNEMIDKPDPQFTILKVSNTIRSFTEAYNELNLMAREIINEKLTRKTILLNTRLKPSIQTNVG